MNEYPFIKSDGLFHLIQRTDPSMPAGTLIATTHCEKQIPAQDPDEDLDIYYSPNWPRPACGACEAAIAQYGPLIGQLPGNTEALPQFRQLKRSLIQLGIDTTLAELVSLGMLWKLRRTTSVAGSAVIGTDEDLIEILGWGVDPSVLSALENEAQHYDIRQDIAGWRIKKEDLRELLLRLNVVSENEEGDLVLRD